MFTVVVNEAIGRICHLPRSNARRDTQAADAAGNKKPPIPVGDERCQARGTTPLRSRVEPAVAFARGACVENALRLLDIGSISACLGRPSPPTGLNASAVRGDAQRSYSLAIQVPLFSRRGSLHQCRQVFVLIVAGKLNCGATLAPPPCSVKRSVERWRRTRGAMANCLRSIATLS